MVFSTSECLLIEERIQFTNGVLELVLPKADNVKPRTIKINASAK